MKEEGGTRRVLHVEELESEEEWSGDQYRPLEIGKPGR